MGSKKTYEGGQETHEQYPDNTLVSEKKYISKENESKNEPLKPRVEHGKIITKLFDEAGKSPKDILAEYKKLPDIPDGGNILAAQGQERKNLFHSILVELDTMINDDGNKKLVGNPPPRVREFVQLLVIEYPEILVQERRDDHTRPLNQALKKMKPLAFDVITLIISNKNIQTLSKNCPLQSLQSDINKIRQRQLDVWLRSAPLCTECTTTLKTSYSGVGRYEDDDFHSKLDLDVLVSPAGGGECPLTKLKLPEQVRERFEKSETSSNTLCPHASIDVKQLLIWANKFREKVFKALELQKNHQNVAENWLHRLFEDETPFRTIRGTNSLSQENFRTLIELCPKEILVHRDEQKMTPLHRAIELYAKSELDFKLLHNVITFLVQKSEESIYFEASYREIKGGKAITTKKTLYRRLRELEPQGSTNLKEEKIRWMAETEKFLRHVCIGSDSGKGCKNERNVKTWKRKYLNEKLASGQLSH